MNGSVSVSSTRWRAIAAATTLIVLASSSTSTSALFVAYGLHWGLTPAGIGLAFSVYIGSLIPVLLIFGGFAERYGRAPIVLTGMTFMAAGTLVLVLAHGLSLLIVARLLQGVGAGVAAGSISATFSESYRGRITAGQALSVVTAAALVCGPIITAIAYDLGGGPNFSYLPMLALGIAVLALTPVFRKPPFRSDSTQTYEAPLPSTVVWCGLRFAMPVIFVAWAGNALYLSLVPAYLNASLHATDALIGAGAFLATQLAAVAASIYFGNAQPEKAGVLGAVAVVLGLVLLVIGTNTHLWAVIVVATILVGAGSGVANGAAYAATATVGRGQRARIFARVLVAAYLGYGIPSLVIGIVATHTSYTVGFASAIAGLAVITASLPFLIDRDAATSEAGIPTPPGAKGFAMCQHFETGPA